MNNFIQIRSNIFFIILMFSMVVLIPMATLNNVRLIVMAIVPVIWLFLMLINVKTTNIYFVKTDVSWLIFILFGLTSFFWAIDQSLIWYQLFSWFCLLMWMLMFRFFSIKQYKFVSTAFVCFFFVTALQCVIAISKSLSPHTTEWNLFLGNNSNFTSSFLVCLYPFILFYNSKSHRWQTIQFLSTIFVIYILYYTSTRGVILGLCLVIIYYLWSSNFKILVWSFLTIFILCASVLLIHYTSPINAFAHLPILNEFGGGGDTIRSYMMNSSVNLFWENPFFGIGLGNWHLEAYKYDISSVSPFNNEHVVKRYRNHNLYGQHLAEIGLVGLLLFLFPITKTLKRGWFKHMQLTSLQKAGYASLLVYLTTSFFYCDVNIYEYHFSGISLIAFCSIGLITNRDSLFYYQSTKWIRLGLLFLSLCCLFWFIHARFSHDKYINIQKIADLQYKSASSKQPLETIRELEAIYNPIFKTTHNYRTLLPFHLASLYRQIGDNQQAEKYYEIALNQAPYHENLLMSYSKFLLKVKKEPIKARIYASRFYKINKKSYDINLIMADIAIEEGKLKEAASYLDWARQAKYKLWKDQVKQLDNKIEKLRE